MREIARLAAFAGGLLVLGAARFGAAAPVDAFTDNGVHASNAGPGLALANDLVVSSPNGVTVQSLGFYDQNLDGLSIAHNVNLYDISGASPVLLGSVSVPAGTTATLDNGFRYVALPSAVFVPNGKTIAVVAYQLDAGSDFYDDGVGTGPGGSAFTGSPALTYVGNSYDFNNETSGVPSGGSNPPDTFGAGSLQFTTPEPASISLLSLGALGLLARRRVS